MPYGTPETALNGKYSVTFYDGDPGLGENTFSVSVQVDGLGGAGYLPITQQDAAFQAVLDYLDGASFLTHRSQASRTQTVVTDVTPT